MSLQCSRVCRLAGLQNVWRRHAPTEAQHLRRDMAGALGYHYDLVRDGDAPDYAKEIQKARAEFKMYRSTLAKRKARKR